MNLINKLTLVTEEYLKRFLFPKNFVDEY